jgi:hypothetical protein
MPRLAVVPVSFRHRIPVISADELERADRVHAGEGGTTTSIAACGGSALRYSVAQFTRFR